ncbi:response regulator [Bacillus sp. B1-b2]|uniref:response regulator n=1 Tax=Bacillus sp. B1-b2 TaxID=2653201 RepID=UPI0012615147|nr:response regulator [Bacillus sp. B1-b2]KAB7669389.1 response regulator [Bacillus sp. B1-b2]
MEIYLLDDEEMALNILEIKLNSLFHHKNEEIFIHKFVNPLHLLESMRNGAKVDLLFLDIEMPEMNGIEVAEEISSWNQDIPIVFLTAYSEYAVKAFELYVMDYLLKPVRVERLQKTIERLEEKRQEVAMQGESPSNQIHVHFLNNFEVYVGKDEAPLNWKTYKVKELCAYFFHHKDAVLDKDKIIDSLWPDTHYEKAKVNFYTCISYLRKMFREIGYEELIHKNGNGYVMNLSFQSDVQELELLTKNASIKKFNQQDYESVLDLYTGDYLEGNDYQWCRSKQEDFQEKYLLFIERLAKELMESHVDLAILYLKKAISLNPYAEKYYQMLIRIHTNHMHKTEGLNVFKQLKEMLEEEFGVTPSRESVELYEILKEL